MRLAYAFLAEAAEAVNGRFFVFGGGIEEVAAPAFPTAIVSLSVVAKIQVEDQEIGRGHTFRLSSVDPDGDSFVPDATHLIQPVVSDAEPGQPVYHLLISTIRGVPIKTPGPHRLMISIDGNEISTLTFYARQRDSSPPAKLQPSN